jgi:hypothetical protein
VSSLEEAYERIDISLVGSNMNRVELEAFEEALDLLVPRAGFGGECRPDPFRTGVQNDRLSCFAVGELKKTESRQFFFSGVVELDGDRVVSLAHGPELAFESNVEEIAYEDHDRTSAEEVKNVLECVGDVGSARARLVREKVADHSEHVSSSLLRRDEKLDVI